MSAMIIEETDWAVEFTFEENGESLRIPIEDELLIGRTSMDQTVFNGLDLAPYRAVEYGVSRQHARIRWQGSNLVISDLHSNNGTLLNNIKLQPDIDYRLNDGDTLCMGQLRIGVRFNQELGPSTIRARRFEFSMKNIPAMGRGQQIMFVEDDPTFVALYKSTFEKSGFNVLTCPEVLNALRMLNQSTPALIVLDLRLSGVHGLELCRYIRRDTECSSIPIVVVSGNSSEQAIQQAMEAGADVYMTKPINIKELSRVVGALIFKTETENPTLSTKQLTASTSLEKIEMTPRNHTAVIFVDGHHEPVTISVDSSVSLGRHLIGSNGRSQPHIDLESYGAFDKGVSRVHARIMRKENQYFIEDAGSSNGTFVDDDLIPPTELCPIKNGQSIRLGTLRMSIYLLGEKE